MPLDIFSGCIAQFVSDQVGTPEDQFSHNEAHMEMTILIAVCNWVQSLYPIWKTYF